MVNKAKIKEEVDAECKIYEFFLEPVVDKIMDQVDLSALPSLNTNIEAEKRLKYREGISDFIYDKEGLYRLKEGFELIIKNTGRIAGGQIIRKELADLGLKQLDKISKAVVGNEEQVAKEMILLRDSMQKDMSSLMEEAEKSDVPLTSADPLADIVTLRSHWGISDQAYELMYEIGCILFNEEHIEEATSVFNVLSILDVKCSEVWFSLGLCAQKKSNFPEALVNYSFAIMTNPEDMYSYVNSAKCYKAIHDEANAKYMLELAEIILEKMEMSSSERSKMRDYLKQQYKNIL